MQVCAITFTAQSGTGVQTVTGVKDIDGDDFIGTLILFLGGKSPINTFHHTTVAGFTDEDISVTIGLDTLGTSEAVCQNDLWTGFGSKSVTTSATNQGSLVTHGVGIAPPGPVQRVAFVSAVRSGEFDVTYTTNTVSGDAILAVVFGGTDLQTATPTRMGGSYPTISLGITPQVAILPPLPTFWGGAPITAASAGGSGLGFGWAARDSGQMGFWSAFYNQGTNARYQLSDACYVTIDPTTQAAIHGTLVEFTDDSLTFDSGVLSAQIPVLVLGGITAAAGTLTQPTSTGTQTINTGLANIKLLLFGSVGLAASSTVTVGTCEFCLGVADGTREFGLWFAENVIGNHSLNGTDILRNDRVLMFGTPAKTSTTFSAVGAMQTFDSSGSFTLNWTSADSTAREILWLALGDTEEPPPPPPPPTTESLLIRFERTFAHVSNLQQWIFWHRLQLDFQSGVGILPGSVSDLPVQGADPVVFLKWSDDGGHTWTPERIGHLGKMGEFGYRTQFWQLGRSRDRLYNVATTEPTIVNLLQAIADIEEGTPGA